MSNERCRASTRIVSCMASRCYRTETITAMCDTTRVDMNIRRLPSRPRMRTECTTGSSRVWYTAIPAYKSSLRFCLAPLVVKMMRCGMTRVSFSGRTIASANKMLDFPSNLVSNNFVQRQFPLWVFCRPLRARGGYAVSDLLCIEAVSSWRSVCGESTYLYNRRICLDAFGRMRELVRALEVLYANPLHFE